MAGTTHELFAHSNHLHVHSRSLPRITPVVMPRWDCTLDRRAMVVTMATATDCCRFHCAYEHAWHLHEGPSRMRTYACVRTSPQLGATLDQQAVSIARPTHDLLTAVAFTARTSMHDIYSKGPSRIRTDACVRTFPRLGARLDQQAVSIARPTHQLLVNSKIRIIYT